MNANEVSSLLARTGHPHASSALDRLLLRRVAARAGLPARRGELVVRMRLAQRAVVAGDLYRAADLVAPVADDGAATKLPPPGEVDALTWTLDVLKAQGRYRDAGRLARRLERVAPYGNGSQKAFGYWQLGQVSLLVGEVEAARSWLEIADGHAVGAGDGLALAWIRATTSDAYRAHDDGVAGDALWAAFDQPTTTNRLTLQFLHIQSAEHARCLGDLGLARRHVLAARAIKVPGQRSLRRRSLNVLATVAIGLWCDGEDRMSDEWCGRVDALRLAYERAGAAAAAADMAALLGGATNTRVDMSQWAERGWVEGWLAC